MLENCRESSVLIRPRWGPAVLRQQNDVSVSHTRITSPSVGKETPKEQTIIDYTCREKAAYASLKKRLCDEISLTLKVKVFSTFLIKSSLHKACNIHASQITHQPVRDPVDCFVCPSASSDQQDTKLRRKKLGAKHRIITTAVQSPQEQKTNKKRNKEKDRHM